MKKSINYLQGFYLQNLYVFAVRDMLDYGIARAKKERPHLTHDDILNEIADACPLISDGYMPGSSGPDYSTWQRQLGYIFVQTIANATAFERAFTSFKQLDNGIRKNGREGYSICAVGGGPGTEVLGLTKLLSTTYENEVFPIQFSFADRQRTWGWLQAQMIRWSQESLHTVNSNHLISLDGAYELNLLNEQDVEAMDPFVESVDLFVFNYVLSENKQGFHQIENSVRKLIERAKTGCHFLVIDRLERDGWLIAEVMRIIRCNLSTEGIYAYKYGGKVSDDRRLLQDYCTSFKYNPRMRLHTQNSDYGVFAVCGVKD